MRFFLTIFLLFFSTVFPAYGAQFDLNQGFNFIEIPSTPSPVYSDYLFNSNKDIFSVFSFNSDKQQFLYQFKLNNDSILGNKFILSPGSGYIIQCSKSVNLTIGGDTFPLQNLKDKINGFHLIGLSGLEGNSCRELIKSNSDIVSIFKWSKEKRAFDYLLKLDNSTILGDDFIVEKGIAYFINFKNSEDLFPPVPGNYGIISFGPLENAKQWISWSNATDNFTDSNELKYKIVYSKTNDIETVVNTKDITTSTEWLDDTNGVWIDNLSSKTNYWFNVLVRDKVGNIAVYNMAGPITTPDFSINSDDTIPPLPGNSGNIGGEVSSISDTTISLSWMAATDLITSQDKLSYRLFYSEYYVNPWPAQIEADTITATNWTVGMLSKSVGNLKTGTKYYFYLMVKDEAENIAVYNVYSTTTGGIPAESNGGDLATTIIEGIFVDTTESQVFKNNDVAITLPSNAIPSGEVVKVEKLKDEATTINGNFKSSDVYEFKTGNTSTFNDTVALQFPYNTSKTTDPENIQVGFWNEENQDWDFVPYVVDLDTNKVFALTKHLSRWSVAYSLTDVASVSGDRFKCFYKIGDFLNVGKTQLSGGEVSRIIVDSLDTTFDTYKGLGYKMPSHMLTYSEYLKMYGKSFWGEHFHFSSKMVVYVDSLYKQSSTGVFPTRRFIYMAGNYIDEAHIKYEAAHEFFHRVQNVAWGLITMNDNRWFMEMTADYAAYHYMSFVTPPPIDLDYFSINSPLTITDNHHEYELAWLIEYLDRVKGRSLRSIWDSLTNSTSPAKDFVTQMSGSDDRGYFYKDFLQYLIFNNTVPLQKDHKLLTAQDEQLVTENAASDPQVLSWKPHFSGNLSMEATKFYPLNPIHTNETSGKFMVALANKIPSNVDISIEVFKKNSYMRTTDIPEPIVKLSNSLPAYEFNLTENDHIYITAFYQMTYGTEEEIADTTVNPEIIFVPVKDLVFTVTPSSLETYAGLNEKFSVSGYRPYPWQLLWDFNWNFNDGTDDAEGSYESTSYSVINTTSGSEVNFSYVIEHTFENSGDFKMLVDVEENFSNFSVSSATKEIDIKVLPRPKIKFISQPDIVNDLTEEVTFKLSVTNPPPEGRAIYSWEIYPQMDSPTYTEYQGTTTVPELTRTFNNFGTFEILVKVADSTHPDIILDSDTTSVIVNFNGTKTWSTYGSSSTFPYYYQLSTSEVDTGEGVQISFNANWSITNKDFIFNPNPPTTFGYHEFWIWGLRNDEITMNFEYKDLIYTTETVHQNEGFIYKYEKPIIFLKDTPIYNSDNKFPATVDGASIKAKFTDYDQSVSPVIVVQFYRTKEDLQGNLISPRELFTTFEVSPIYVPWLKCVNHVYHL